jgi:DNA helicase HerA-like ATPase
MTTLVTLGDLGRLAEYRIADGLALPVELAGRRTAVFGISGSGKSNTATVLVEQLLRPASRS